MFVYKFFDSEARDEILMFYGLRDIKSSVLQEKGQQKDHMGAISLRSSKVFLRVSKEFLEVL